MEKNGKKWKKNRKKLKFGRCDQPAVNWSHVTKGTNQFMKTKSQGTTPTLSD